MNTLLRERQGPCSFKIGARMYGVRTFSTYSADEDNKEGSEFEILRLDAVLRENKHYEEFARRLVAKRLVEFNPVSAAPTTLDAIARSLNECFEEPGESRFSVAETGYVVEKYKNRERPYFKTVRQHLEQGTRANATPRRISPPRTGRPCSRATRSRSRIRLV